MKVYLSTLGCKLNESELEAWTRRFAADGSEIVASPVEADVCVVNTCTVTQAAARKSRQMARQLARANPNARLVLTGCYATIAPGEARALPNVALVVPNAEKDQLVRMANSVLPIADCAAEVTSFSSANPKSKNPASNFQPRTRAFVKIQDGCNMSCTYCIIPLARGKERSRPMEEIVSEAQSLVDAGYKEIILTGVQISEYRDVVAADCQSAPNAGWQPAATLRDLVAAILRETNVPRLRLTSIAPWDLDESLLDLFGEARLCRHLHLSLQSGSDSVLRRMRRPYTTAQFARAVELAREKIPDVGITTDVIVGFPGESEVEFAESLDFVERMRFARVHVFSYSARAGTVAAGLPHHVSNVTKQARIEKMQAVADIAARTFASRFIGRTVEVLWENIERGSAGAGEHEREAGISLQRPSTSAPLPMWSGYTDNYIRVTAVTSQDMHNRILPAVLVGLGLDGATTILSSGGQSCSFVNE